VSRLKEIYACRREAADRTDRLQIKGDFAGPLKPRDNLGFAANSRREPDLLFFLSCRILLEPMVPDAQVEIGER
jgi:hypothetical protein